MVVIETSAGPVEVTEHGESGRTLLLIGGLAMSGTVWRKVIAALPDLHCVTVTLPLGAHTRAMKPGADLSLTGLSRIQGEVIEQLDLRDAVLVGNDSGAYLATAVAWQRRLAGLVVTSCEAFDHFPPGLPGRTAAAAARVPGALSLMTRALRFPLLRSSPTVFGWMARSHIPRHITDAWVAPMRRDPRILRDLQRYLLSATAMEMQTATESLRAFTKPALVVWTPEDRVMDPTHGRRIAELLPSATYREISGSYTLVPEDRPDELAGAIREFVDTL